MTTRFSDGKPGHISISIKQELIDVADEVAKEMNTSRSKVISRCLEELARHRREQAMVNYYKAMDAERAQFLDQTQATISDIFTSWSD